MTTSQVSLCNAALIKLGEKTIMTLADNNDRASACAERYDNVLGQVLRAHPWNFAIARQTLAQLSTAPDFEFSYEYQLPTDCIRVLRINPEDGLSPGYVYGWGSLSDAPLTGKPIYRLEGRVIVTDLESIDLIYVKRETDPTVYDEGFIEAFACTLAAEVCMRLTSNRELKKEMLQEYIMAIRVAKSQNATEDTAMPLYSDDFITFSRR